MIRLVLPCVVAVFLAGCATTVPDSWIAPEAVRMPRTDLDPPSGGRNRKQGRSRQQPEDGFRRVPRVAQADPARTGVPGDADRHDRLGRQPRRGRGHGGAGLGTIRFRASRDAGWTGLDPRRERPSRRARASPGEGRRRHPGRKPVPRDGGELPARRSRIGSEHGVGTCARRKPFPVVHGSQQLGRRRRRPGATHRREAAEEVAVPAGLDEARPAGTETSASGDGSRFEVSRVEHEHLEAVLDVGEARVGIVIQ